MSKCAEVGTGDEAKLAVARATAKAFDKLGFGAARAAAVLGIQTERVRAIFRGEVLDFDIADLEDYRDRARGPIRVPAGAPTKSPGTQAIDVAERLWARVDRSDPAACWLWTAALDDKGYPRIKCEGRMELATRVAFRLVKGNPGKRLVFQSCGAKACINPAHLRAGTKSQSMLLCASRGRLNTQNKKGAVGQPGVWGSLPRKLRTERVGTKVGTPAQKPLYNSPLDGRQISKVFCLDKEVGGGDEIRTHGTG